MPEHDAVADKVKYLCNTFALISVALARCTELKQNPPPSPKIEKTLIPKNTQIPHNARWSRECKLQCVVALADCI